MRVPGFCPESTSYQLPVTAEAKRKRKASKRQLDKLSEKIGDTIKKATQHGKNKEEQAMVKLRNRADNTEQSSEPSDDPRVCAVLCNSKMQVDALKVKLSKLSSQQSRDMEVPPKRCRAANAELLSVLYNINYL